MTLTQDPSILDNRDKEVIQPFGHPLGTATCILVWEVFPDIPVEEAWGIDAANKTINSGFRKWWKLVRGTTELRAVAWSDSIAVRLRSRIMDSHNPRVHTVVLERRNMDHLFAAGDLELVRKNANLEKPEHEA